MIENTEGFTTIIRMIEFPMFFLSGALLPITVIKGIPVLYQLQFINPLTYGVDGYGAPYRRILPSAMA